MRVTVKNIRVTLDDETYRRVRIRAAELGTSVSALVKRCLIDLVGSKTEFEHLEKLERTLSDRVVADPQSVATDIDSHRPQRGLQVRTA